MSNSTPCTRAGYQVGDRFTIIETNSWFTEGELVELCYDDGTTMPQFRSVEWGCKWYDSLDNVTKVPDTPAHTAADTVRYFIRREDGLDITAGKAYVVGSDGKYRDDAGDDRFAGTRDAIYGEAKFIIRCLDAPNKSCVGKYIDQAFDPEVGNVGCEAEHKAAAHQFTLPEVIEFLRFTRKKHDEQGKTSSFEVLLAPILCTFEGEFKKPEPVGTGGYKVGDRLICEASSHRGLLVGEEYVVYRIDADDDECIEPAGSGRLALSARYAASGNSDYNEGCKFRKVEG